MSPQLQRNDPLFTMEVNSDEAEEMILTVEQPQHHHKRRPRRHNRNQRGAYREVTLVPGSPFHEAFFGTDETVRQDFNCEDHLVSFCNNRDLTRSTRNGNHSDSSSSARSLDSRQFLRERQDSDLSMMSDISTASSASSVAYKAGRPMLPRYAEF